MIDRSFADFGRFQRAPDLRLGDIRTEVIRAAPPFLRDLALPDRGVFIYARRGDFVLEIKDSTRGPIAIKQGSAIGFEGGRAHRWRADSASDAGIAVNEQVELFISSIPRQMGVLQSMDEGVLIVPHDAEPFATLFRHAVEIHICEFESRGDDGDESVIRRAAETCMIEFVRYARARMANSFSVPSGLSHDEHLLRAWSAYFNDPQRRWTVKALAEAAGLGRTVFAERFRAIFGTPPLQTLTSMRLAQAETMLRHSTTPLIEIAFTVGYNSEAAFVRAFHRQYGMPPGRFRAECRTR